MYNYICLEAVHLDSICLDSIRCTFTPIWLSGDTNVQNRCTDTFNSTVAPRRVAHYLKALYITGSHSPQ